MEPVKVSFERLFQSLLRKRESATTGDLRTRYLVGEQRCGKMRMSGKSKGCDIGYALAASSCEGANSVEACTVTALDAITAFAVPNPNFSSQSRRFFQVRMPVELPLRANHSAYFGLARFYLKPTLSAVDASHPKHFLQSCQCRFSVQNLKFASETVEEAIY
jgi:hypothetical protein